MGQVTPFGSPVVPLVNWMFLEDVNDGGSTVEVAAVHLSVIRERHDPTRRGRIKRSPTQPCFRSNLYKAVEILVPVFARVVVIATGEFDEHARLIAHRPRIVTRWQQHDVVL